MAKRIEPKGQPAMKSGDAWHGFNTPQFDESADSALKTVESIERHLSAIKAVINDARKRGTISAFTESDAVVKLANACEHFRDEIPLSLKALEAVQQQISQWRSAERGSRRLRFEAAAKENAWQIYGNWPEPVVAGTVFVVVDDSNDKATVNGRTVSGLPTAEKLVADVARELAELERNKTEPTKFIGLLWKAYQSCGGKVDEGAMVYDLLREMLWQRQNKKFQRDPAADQFRPYPMALFRADLTAYLAAGSPPVTEGSRHYALEIVGGSYAEHGLFMYFPQTNRLATCGRLTFRSSET